MGDGSTRRTPGSSRRRHPRIRPARQITGPPRDSPSIATERDIPDEQAAALFAAYRRARAAGDDDAAIAAYADFLAVHMPLMRNKIASMVYGGQVRYVAKDEIGDVAHDAWFRAQGMALTFEGEAHGQLRAALVTCAFNTCRDADRFRWAREKHVAGSLDETHTYGDGIAGENRYAQDIAQRESDEAALDRLLAHDELGRIAAALEQLPDDQAEVLRLSWAGYSSKEIARMVGTSVNNVDARRSRGMRKLRELLSDDLDD